MSRTRSVSRELQNSVPIMDCIDLTEISDSEDAATPENRPQGADSMAGHSPVRRPTADVCLDDSLAVLYEKIKPPPELVIVNEVQVFNHIPARSSPSLLSTPNHNVPVVLGNPAVLELDSPDPAANASEVCSNVHAASSGAAVPNSKESSIQCGICLESLDEILASSKNIMSTNCGHIFCRDCIDTSFRVSSACPKCRKRIYKKQIRPIYF